MATATTANGLEFCLTQKYSGTTEGYAVAFYFREGNGPWEQYYLSVGLLFSEQVFSKLSVLMKESAAARGISCVSFSLRTELPRSCSNCVSTNVCPGGMTGLSTGFFEEAFGLVERRFVAVGGAVAPGAFLADIRLRDGRGIVARIERQLRHEVVDVRLAQPKFAAIRDLESFFRVMLRLDCVTLQAMPLRQAQQNVRFEFNQIDPVAAGQRLRKVIFGVLEVLFPLCGILARQHHERCATSRTTGRITSKSMAGRGEGGGANDTPLPAHVLCAHSIGARS